MLCNVGNMGNVDIGVKTSRYNTLSGYSLVCCVTNFDRLVISGGRTTRTNTHGNSKQVPHAASAVATQEVSAYLLRSCCRVMSSRSYIGSYIIASFTLHACPFVENLIGGDVHKVASVLRNDAECLGCSVV